MPQIAEVVENSVTDTVTQSSPSTQTAPKKTRPRSRASSNTKAGTVPNEDNSLTNSAVSLPQNTGFARAPIAALAGIMKAGTDGMKTVVKTGTDVGSTTIDQAGSYNNRFIDFTQDGIQQVTGTTVGSMLPLMSTLDTFRRSFSGNTKSNAGKAHSITVTTESDAPINSMYSFMNEYMPTGGSPGSSALPPITSVDMSNFSYFG